MSKYCSLHLPAFVKTLSSYKAGDFKQALIDAFLKFDQTLTKLETIEVLKQLAQFESGDEGDEDEVREETDKLREEAKMPLEEILMIYKTVSFSSARIQCCSVKPDSRQIRRLIKVLRARFSIYCNKFMDFVFRLGTT